MSDKYVESAKENMGAIERLLKGLPGIRGYVDKELRRDADKQLRTMLAGQLEEQKQALFAIQKQLLSGGGLLLMDDLDSAIQKLQILIDRIKTASYGYAGLFDAVRVGEEQLDALYRFDVALTTHVVTAEKAVESLQQAVAGSGDPAAQIHVVSDLYEDLNTLFNRRNEAVVSPDLLTEPSFAPEVNPDLMSSTS